MPGIVRHVPPQGGDDACTQPPHFVGECLRMWFEVQFHLVRHTIYVRGEFVISGVFHFFLEMRIANLILEGKNYSVLLEHNKFLLTHLT